MCATNHQKNSISNIDIDFFSVLVSSPKTLSATPYNMGINNEGGNVDLVIKLYNSQMVFISLTDNSLILSSGVSLVAGQYYVAINTGANTNSTTYGMLGKYKIAVQ